MMALTSEHCHRVMEDEAAALNTLVQPACSMLLFVDWDRESLAAAVVLSINDSNIEFIRTLGEVMGAGHSYEYQFEVI